MKIKKIVRDNFYRPKNPVNSEGELSVRCYKKFVNNFIDSWDWGNNKRHFYYHNRKYHSANKELLNLSLTTQKTNRAGTKKWDDSLKYKLTEKEVSTHLHTADSQEYVFYVNSQFSHTPLICLDIDTLKTTTDLDLQEVVSFLLKLHPNSYFEKSTNGKGIHFYILLDLSDYKMDTKCFNKAFSDYSRLLKRHINDSYNVKFDGIKSTYSHYSFSEKHKKYLLERCGLLCKLPKPVTLTEYTTLYSIPFTTLETIDSNAKSLCNYINSLVTYRNAVSCLSATTTTATATTTTKTSDSYKNKKIDYEITDSWDRENKYLFDFFSKYYKENNEIPLLSECKCNYRKDTGYLKTGTKRENRFKEHYEKMVNYFNPKKLKKKRKAGIYVKNDYVEDIKKLYTKDQLMNLQREINPKFKGVIKFEDISLAAGFYFVSLTRLLPQKKFSKSEFTVAQNNMILWFKDLNDKFETSRKCNTTKVSILREILKKIGWLKVVDKTYFSGKRSRRHILTEQFPKYLEFVELVGKENIEKWVEFSENKKEIRKIA